MFIYQVQSIIKDWIINKIFFSIWLFLVVYAIQLYCPSSALFITVIHFICIKLRHTSSLSIKFLLYELFTVIYTAKTVWLLQSQINFNLMSSFYKVNYLFDDGFAKCHCSYTHHMFACVLQIQFIYKKQNVWFKHEHAARRIPNMGIFYEFEINVHWSLLSLNVFDDHLAN